MHKSFSEIKPKTLNHQKHLSVFSEFTAQKLIPHFALLRPGILFLM